MKKVAGLEKFRSAQNLNFLIEIDGGVNLQTAGILGDAGADILVAGNSVFRSDNPSAEISRLKDSK